MKTKEINVPSYFALYAKDEPNSVILPLTSWLSLYNDLDDKMSVADAIKTIGLYRVVKVIVEVKE